MLRPPRFVRRVDWSELTRRGLLEVGSTFAGQCLELDELAAAADGAVLVALVEPELLGRFATARDCSEAEALDDYLRRAAPVALYRPGAGAILDVQFTAAVALTTAVDGRPVSESAERHAEDVVRQVVRRATAAPAVVAFHGIPGVDDVTLEVDLGALDLAAASVDAVRALTILQGVAGGAILLDGAPPAG